MVEKGTFTKINYPVVYAFSMYKKTEEGIEHGIYWGKAEYGWTRVTKYNQRSNIFQLLGFTLRLRRYDKTPKENLNRIEEQMSNLPLETIENMIFNPPNPEIISKLNDAYWFSEIPKEDIPVVFNVCVITKIPERFFPTKNLYEKKEKNKEVLKMKEETKSPKEILRESLTTDLQQLKQKATNLDRSIVNLEQQTRIAREQFLRTLGAIDGIQSSIKKLSLLDDNKDVE